MGAINLRIDDEGDEDDESLIALVQERLASPQKGIVVSLDDL